MSNNGGDCGEKRRGGVEIFFLMPQGKNEKTCSEILSDAYEQSQDNGLTPSWIAADKVLTKKPTKTDVFVVDPFEGKAFEHLTGFRCTIVGPMCLLACLQKSEPVPDLPYPMYTASMTKLIVTSTGFSRDKKEEIQMKVERMGGIYSNAFHDGVTHLVCNEVRSKKYDVAVLKEIPIMTSDWVHQVWEKSKHEYIHATDPIFTRYKCPVLQGLCITVSQYGKKDRELLKKSVESHGGSYTPTLDMNTTTIVILNKADGDKYRYAKRWKIPCITSDWVYDSIEKGHCLPTEGYLIDRLEAKVSTPEKNGTVPRLQDVSMCTTICHPNDQSVTKNTVKVDETVNMTKIGGQSFANEKKTNENIFLDLERVKKSGHFLAECKLFLSGFSMAEIDKLRLSIQTAGGVCLSQLTPSVTHMVIRNAVPDHFQIVHDMKLTPYKVNFEWILQSMLMGRPVPEEDFHFSFQLEQKPNTEQVETQYEDDILAQYTDENNAGGDPIVNEDKYENDDTTVVPFFQDKKFYLIGQKSEDEVDMVDYIGEAGGEVVSMEYEGDIDYLITGLTYDPTKKTFKMKPKEILNKLWVEDCLDECRIIKEQLYYHYPITLDPALAPCQGAVVSVTNYTGRERVYITELATALGMVAQDVFAKRDKKGAQKNTHLISSTAEGPKYKAGIDWKMCIVTKDWLVKCLEYKTWVSEKPFLVGAATTFTPDKPNDEDLERPKTPVQFEQEEPIGDDDDDEIVIKMPTVKKIPDEEKILENEKIPKEKEAEETVTPKTSVHHLKKRLTMDTPVGELYEKFKPKRYEDLDVSGEGPSPSKWRAGSEPSFAGTQFATQDLPESQGSGQKRKADEIEDFALRGVLTPDTPYGAFLGKNPSKSTRKFFKKQCEDLEKFGVPELQQKRQKLDESYVNPDESISTSPTGQVPTPIREKWKDDLEAKGMVVLARDKRRFSDIMEEKAQKLGKSWKDPGRKIKIKNRSSFSQPKEVPLKGVVVFVTKKCEKLRNDIFEKVQKLGGQVRSIYDSLEVTHVIFVGKNNDLTKEFRLAREDGKSIVSPEWINMCYDENRKVEEVLFPHTYNPKMSLNMSVLDKPKRNVEKTLLEPKENPPVKEIEEPIPSEEKVFTSTECVNLVAEESQPNTEAMNDELAKIDQLIDAEENPNDRNSAGRMRLSSFGNSPEGRSRSKLNQKSQVMWEDPRESKSKKRLTRSLDKTTQNQATFDSMEIPENLTEQMMNEEENNKENDDKCDMTQACFSFSNFRDEIREKYMDFVLAQGGQVSEQNQLCDPKATHVVAQKMSRSEKMLGSICSGKWIIHENYIIDCIKENRLLENFADYEWGNEANGYLATLEKPMEKLNAEASYRWRQVVSKNPNKGPFSGMKAIIHSTDSRKGAFARMIFLGKGSVLEDVYPPYRNVPEATHCIAEPKKLPNVSIDFDAMARQRIAVVGPLYLNEYIIQDPLPDVEDSLLEEYKPFWKKYKMQ